MVGMRDVAKKAGVSLSTVSLVVNGNGYVSNDMRDRVRKAMQALNYVPNELARNLYHDRTNLVGVIEYKYVRVHCKYSSYGYTPLLSSGQIKRRLIVEILRKMYILQCLIGS